MYDSDQEKLRAIRRQEAEKRKREELFPGESLDLPEENPRHYQNYSNNYGYGRDVLNYNNNYGEEEPWQEEAWEDGEEESWEFDAPEEEAWPEEEAEPSVPVIHAYNADFSRDAGAEEKSRKKQASPPRRAPQQAQEELRRHVKAQPLQEEPPRKRKKRHIFRKILGFFLILCLVAVGLCFLLKRMPRSSDSLGERKPGCASILLAGLDDDAVRTDTMMLLFLDGENGGVNLLSLPRDTYVGGNYSVPKLNSVYGGNGGGKAGMEALMDEVKKLIGYRPDGYLVVELDAFVDIVNAMGGVKFNVPQDMYYDDPSQDLHIDLKEGMQRLNGKDAMGLVRYRSGYAMADLRRVEVQRDFVAAAMEQWLSPIKIFRYPAAAAALLSKTKGNLSLGNLVWVAGAVRKANLGELSTKTLPGEAAYIGDGSYYVVWPNATASLINESFNPYVRDITADDLQIAG